MLRRNFLLSTSSKLPIHTKKCSLFPTNSSSSSSRFLFTPTRITRQFYTPEQGQNYTSNWSESNQQKPKPSELLRQVDPFESMPRYPSFNSVMGCVRGLDYLGTIAFSVSGSLLAATYGLNAFGCITVGATTALGGGAIRDIIFGTLPVAFIDEYEYLIFALAAAAITFTCCLLYTPTPKHMADYESAMFWLDTVGLGAFCVIGTMYGARRGLPLILILLGTVLCCTGGGVCRDLMVRRPPRILNNYAEAYAECVILGSLVYCLVKKARFSTAYRAVAGWSTVVVARYIAATYNYSLPQAIALRSKYQAPSHP